MDRYKNISTFEEAQDAIVHLRDALFSVYSDKRKLESEFEALKTTLAETVKEKEEIYGNLC